ncbi:MAG: hypothetical protein WBB82_14880 [Limnothrix sp.]
MPLQQPTFNPHRYLRLYLEGQYDELSELLIEVLGHFEQVLYVEATAELQYFVDVFIKNFLYLFSQPDYIVGDRHALRFIQLNPVIANLTAISYQRTTDFYLELLQRQPQNYIKILALLNPRCTIELDYLQLFETNASLSSRWYSYYVELYLSAQVSPIGRKNLRQHIAYNDDQRLVEFANIADVYFGATYINHEGDRPIKQRINKAIQNNAFCQNANIQNQPNPQKLAIVTALWHKNHSVHRTLAEFLDAAKTDYELTLIKLGGSQTTDESLFETVIQLDIIEGSLNIDPIRHNDFGIVYFPDIGMSPESILLSNLRLAPIQLAGTGHPASTFGAQIDYVVSGADVELPNLSAKNYDERLVLLPGNGAIHSRPDYAIQHLKKSRPEVIVNCPWLAQKINEPLVKLLAYIQKKTAKDIFFRFFVGSSLRKNGFIPFVRDLEAVLEPDTFEVVPGKPYADYMALMEAGDLCLDSYPFGGSNVLADTLYLRKPTVGYEGKKWANRIGAQMLRQVGLNELVATNANDYVKLAIKLVDNTAYRQGVGDRLKKIDLNQTIFNTEQKKYFTQALHYLQANHAELSAETAKKPIYISP